MGAVYTPMGSVSLYKEARIWYGGWKERAQPSHWGHQQ